MFARRCSELSETRSEQIKRFHHVFSLWLRNQFHGLRSSRDFKLYRVVNLSSFEVLPRLETECER